jgi:hypothetical protein
MRDNSHSTQVAVVEFLGGAHVYLDEYGREQLRSLMAAFRPSTQEELGFGIPASRRDRRHPVIIDRPPLPTEKHYPTSTSPNGARRVNTRRTQ